MNRLIPNPNKAITPHVVANPVGADIPCKEIQSALSSIISKSFAKAQTFTTTEGITYPAVYVGDGRDYFNALGSVDNFDSISFCRVNDPQQFDEEVTRIRQQIRYNIDVFVWLDLEHHDVNGIGDYTESVIKQCREAIVRNSDLVTVNQVFTQPSNVLTGYTSDNGQQKTLSYPYSGFRMNLSYILIEPC